MVRLLVTKEEYFEAAMNILATEGAGQIKVTTLCAALGVTSGSFYGYFGNLGGFVSEFLQYWEESQTERIAAMATMEPDSRTRIRLLKDLAAGLPHAAEGAIRSWAHTNPDVAKMQQFVDERRVEALTTLFKPALGSTKESREMARFGITLLIGMQQWGQPVTRKDFNALFDRFEEILLIRINARSAAAH